MELSDGIQQEQNPFQAAGEAAQVTLSAAQLGGDPESTPQEPAAPEPAPAPAPEGRTWDWDYEGQRVKLNEATVNEALSLATRYLRAQEEQRVLQQEPAPQVPEEPQAPPAQPAAQDKALAHIQKLQERLDRFENQALQREHRARLEQELAAINQKNPLFKAFAADPKKLGMLQGLALNAHSLLPNVSLEQAASQIESLFEEHAKRSRSQYVETKIKQDQLRTDGPGGSVAQPSDEQAGKDLFNGNAARRAAARLAAAFAAK